MRRKKEAVGSGIGLASGVALGAKIGARIGIAVGGPVGAIAGTVPCAIVGGALLALLGNKVGTEADRYDEE